MQNPYGPPPPPRRSGLPGWAWALIACGSGCGCLALVAILAAILFPVFAQARMKARQVSCMSNVRQMELAVQMYAQDHNEALPDSNAWMDSIQSYLPGGQKASGGPNLSVFHCPGVPAGDYGYAFNSRLSRKLLKNIGTPNATVLLYDSSDLARNASDPVASLPVPSRHLANNIGFVDGHVQAQRSRSYAAPPP